MKPATAMIADALVSCLIILYSLLVGTVGANPFSCNPAVRLIIGVRFPYWRLVRTPIAGLRPSLLVSLTVPSLHLTQYEESQSAPRRGPRRSARGIALQKRAGGQCS